MRALLPPGHGSRGDELPLLRVARLAEGAADAIGACVPAGVHIALFGHGLGALVAYEVRACAQQWSMDVDICSTPNLSPILSKGGEGDVKACCTVERQCCSIYAQWHLPSLQGTVPGCRQHTARCAPSLWLGSASTTAPVCVRLRNEIQTYTPPPLPPNHVWLQAARRLSGWARRPPLHLFVSGCASPDCWPSNEHPDKRYTPW